MIRHQNKNGFRKILKNININFEEIITSVNVYRANNKKIPRVYEYIIKKLVKQILLENFKNIYYINIQIDKNLLNVEFNSGKKLNCKLIKFIQKYQSFKPDKYKCFNVSLVISSNWKDILFQSTFKQWTSCTNLLKSDGQEFCLRTPIEEILNR